MSDKDLTYYRQRAAAELELARRATAPIVRNAHQELADAYLRQVGEPQPGPSAN